jgi:8-oxo-dGTP pyrophosphatase MutT (NUDIX family)
VSLHACAVRELAGWQAPSPDQLVLKASYLGYLRAHADAMWRSCRPAHVTASALVLDPAAGRVLLTLHPKIGRWLQLGGHCEPDDLTIAGAARREAVEESGIESLQILAGPLRLDRHAVGCGADGSSADHLDVQYLALASHRLMTARSAESLDLRWWPVEALPAGTDASVRSLVDAAVGAVG